MQAKKGDAALFWPGILSRPLTTARFRTISRTGVAPRGEKPMPPSSPPFVESDPRFPSGSWLGYVLKQHEPGHRHAMVASLSFIRGVISGAGSDEDGDFTISGRYESRDAKCIWIQTHSDRREVIYTGYCDGQGIWGMWYRPRETGSDWKGGFHFVPEGMSDPTPLPLTHDYEPKNVGGAKAEQ